MGIYEPGNGHIGKSSEEQKEEVRAHIAECEEGCGCTFEIEDAFVAEINGMKHLFCCSDCADEYRNVTETATSLVLKRHVKHGFTVVDVGFGNGFYLPLLLELVGPEGNVIALDRSIREAKHSLLSHGIDDDAVEMHAASAGKMNFIPSGSAHFVLSNDVLCCMRNRAAAMREMERILAPEGKLYIRVSLTPVRNRKAMTEEEWRMILDRFHVIERGKAGKVRWALIRRPG